MKICKVIFSAQEPNVREALWLRPVAGGFSLYFLSGGRWLPLKLIDDNGTSKTSDDAALDVDGIISAVVGSVQDESSANTINGAKAYTASVIGTEDDTAEDLTLYGLKKAIEALDPSEE